MGAVFRFSRKRERRTFPFFRLWICVPFRKVKFRDSKKELWPAPFPGSGKRVSFPIKRGRRSLFEGVFSASEAAGAGGKGRFIATKNIPMGGKFYGRRRDRKGGSNVLSATTYPSGRNLGRGSIPEGFFQRGRREIYQGKGCVHREGQNLLRRGRPDLCRGCDRQRLLPI